MLMSGLTPFPREHWPQLAKAIERQRYTHPLIAGCQLRGPLKHYWGLSSRYTGDDNPYSLFLALGIPFEVVEEPQDGWTFLSQADALDWRRRGLAPSDAQLVFRPGDCTPFKNGLAVEETLTALFEFKHSLILHLTDVPYIREDVPVVLAWYPDVRRVLVWNLSETLQRLTLRLNDWDKVLEIGPLDVEVVFLSR